MAKKPKAQETEEIKKDAEIATSEGDANTQTVPELPKDEDTAPVLVRVFIPKDPTNKKEADKFVGVNGRNCLIKRGEYVDVPPEVAEVIMLSNLNAELADDYIESNSI